MNVTAGPPTDAGGGNPPPAGPARPRGSWPPWSAPLALLAGFVAAALGALIVAIVGSSAGASVSHPPPSVQIIDTAVQDAALVLTVVLFAHSYGRARAVDFGLQRTRAWPAIGMAVGFGFAFLAFLAVWSSALNIHDDEKLIDQLGANKSEVAAAAVALLVSVIAPFAEEFVFRGYFFGALRSWRGPWVAALLTGIMFGAIHAGSTRVENLVPLAFFGFVLCILRWRTGSLWPGIALHSINNSVALGVGLNWGWEIAAVIVGALTLLGTLALALDRTIARPAVAQ